jgi:TIR domain-containing protein
MIDNERFCAVCGRDGAEIRFWREQYAGFELLCSYCGHYKVEAQTYRWMREHVDEPLLRYLAAYIRQATEPPIITLQTWRPMALAAQSSTVDQRTEKLLDFFRKRSKVRGVSVPFEDADRPWIDAASDEEATHILRLLLQRGLIEPGPNGYALTERGWETGSLDPSKPRRVFLSHASDDAKLAMSVASEVRSRLPGMDVFVSSQPGQIPTGDKWLEAVEDKLQRGDTFIILLTPASISRRWVWFETGSFWFSGKRILPVAYGINLGDIPHPLSVRQALSLEDPPRLKQFFDDLTIRITDTEAADLVQAFRVAAQQDPVPWASTDFEGQTYVWGGPLNQLDDWSAMPASRALMAHVEALGYCSRCGRPYRLGRHVERGYQQVFASDLRAFKRPLTCPEATDQLWLIRPASAGPD